MQCRLPVLTLILATPAGLVPGASYAHGGEQHSPAAPKVSMTSTAGLRLAFAQTENFEFLIKHPEQTAGEPMELRIFLADSTTNRPIQSATIELEFSGPVDIEAQARATASPGVYQVTATFPLNGTYEVLASVAAGEIEDLIAINGIEVGPPKTETHDHADASLPWLWSWVAGVALVAIALLGVLAVRRRGRTTTGGTA